ncbi:MAG: SAM-dependent methyltransferase, partial [Sphingomonas bacterium]
FGRGRQDAELIRFHYDVSNDFYRLFLDPEMQYSCAVFGDGSEDLAAAQVAKMDLICRKLRLQPGDRLLDIGCGWGGLAAHAARVYGAHVHGVTLSAEQLAFAQAKIDALGLGDRVTLELRDYRTIDTPGAYDKIVQIEMFEHVGLDNHDRHFEQVRTLLKMRGLYLHQATTRRATRDIARFRKPTPYQGVINRFIFPGGELDHIGMSVTNLERLGFEVHDVESFREHYVRTLRMWSDALYAHRAAAEAEIGAARTRLWQLYFALFGLGFERSLCGNFQTLASKRQPGPSGLPLSGAPRA